jgi:hypothetical protein
MMRLVVWRTSTLKWVSMDVADGCDRSKSGNEYEYEYDGDEDADSDGLEVVETSEEEDSGVLWEERDGAVYEEDDGSPDRWYRGGTGGWEEEGEWDGPSVEANVEKPLLKVNDDDDDSHEQEESGSVVRHAWEGDEDWRR